MIEMQNKMKADPENSCSILTNQPRAKEANTEVTGVRIKKTVRNPLSFESLEFLPPIAPTADGLGSYLLINEDSRNVRDSTREKHK